MEIKLSASADIDSLEVKSTCSWEQAVLWLRNQPEKSELVKHCYYDDPITNAADRYFDSDEWSAVKQIIGFKFPCNVLDIGAGRGISSYAFSKSKCKVTAIEPDQSDIVGSGAINKLFEMKKLPITIVKEYGEKLPFKDESFDIVYGRAVLHHAKNLNLFCSEASRVLKKGGYLLFTREHVLSKKKDIDVFFQTHALHMLYGGENAYTLKEYISAIVRSGVKIKKILSPFSTPINYAPQTKKEHDKMIDDSIQKWFGNNLPKTVIEFLRQLFVLYTTYRSAAPGRLYSFLASKQ